MPASASSPVPDAKIAPKHRQSAATQTASNAPTTASGSRAIANPKLMGTVDLSKLPTAPDGRQLVAPVNGVPVPEKRFLAALRAAAGSPEVPGAAARQVGLAEPVLQRLILDSLYEEFAKKNSLRISDAEVQHEF